MNKLTFLHKYYGYHACEYESIRKRNKTLDRFLCGKWKVGDGYILISHRITLQWSCLDI